MFGDYAGLEHALWFAPKGSEPREDITFRRSNAHPVVAEECRAVREAVGLIETSNYGKFTVEGRGAEAWLARVMANRMPAEGRIVLTPMLNERGRLIGDFTIAKLGPERFFLVGTLAAERFYQRWFERQAPPEGVAVRACAAEILGFSIAGPRARELLQALVRDDLGTAAFPFLSFRQMDVGAVPAMVGRISFAGDLGYEIWVTADYHRRLHELLREAGAKFGLRPFGGRALHSLRLEKSFGTWAREYRPIYGPYEAGLGRFVDLGKADFVGKAAAAAEKAKGPARRLVAFAVDAGDADAIGDEPVFHDGKTVGWVTSGGYAHHAGTSAALGYVPAALASASGGFEIEILGERRKARRLDAPLFDPTGARMRA